MSRKILSCLLVFACVILSGEVKAGDPLVKVLSEPGKWFFGKLPDWINSWTSEHDRFYPIDDSTIILPMCDCGKSRISYNFNHKSWVPRGSDTVRIRLTVHGVDKTIRNQISFRMKADKRMRTDRFRSDIVYHGSEFDLWYGTGKDRAYYFVERGQIKGQHLPRGAYIKLVLLD